jgi:heme/copper-type cytochrome/quinol oxidase subunit 2
MDTLSGVTPTAMPPARRKPLSALSKWLVFTLAAIVLMLIWLQVAVVRGFSPPLVLILGLPTLVVAVPIVATRWRWVPLLGALYWLLLIVMNWKVTPYDITHPEAYNTFAFTVIAQALTVVGIVAGVGATVQNYRRPGAGLDADPRRVPRWFPTLLWTLAGLCLGALLVGAIARTSVSSGNAGVSPQALAALPALGVKHFKFDQQELRVKAGEVVALRLENRDDRAHSFDIDEFNVHVPIAIGQASLALFTPDKPGTYTFYCSVPGHRSMMVGTLIVEP